VVVLQAGRDEELVRPSAVEDGHRHQLEPHRDVAHPRSFSADATASREARHYDRRMEALRQIDAWDVPFAAAGVTRADAALATRGDTDRSVRLASVSKP